MTYRLISEKRFGESQKVLVVRNSGYILLDILLGLFILGMGLAVILGLNNSTVLKSGQVDSSLQAVNLASSTLDELLCEFDEDKSYIDKYTSVEVKDTYGIFERIIRAEWKTMNLVLLTVKIEWLERGISKEYYLESYYYAQPS